MKKIIFFTLLLVSCIFTASCGANKSTDETMPPLTTDLDRAFDQTVVITQPIITSPWTHRNEAYLDYVWQNADVPISVLDFNLMSYAEIWCDFMRRGMSKTNLLNWINEMATDQEEIDLWLVTAEASSIFVCSDQGYKWNP